MLKGILKMLQSLTQKKYEDITVSEFKEKLKDANWQILDVRTASEIRSGKVQKARHADVMSPDFRTKIGVLDFNKPIAVYCRSGNRSKMACSLLANQGAKEVYNLLGGYSAFERNQ